MNNAFDPDLVVFEAGPRVGGNAAQSLLTPSRFTAAIDEITRWPGYGPTPLHRLDALAAAIDVGGILYKDEGSRFGLGSFKALGAAYGAARLLQRELSKRIGQPVTLAQVRTGELADEASTITLTAATDGNHGRSLAWGCRRFGSPCRIYVHKDVSEGRVRAMEALGATVIRIDGDYDASVSRARHDADRNGWFVVSDTSWEGYVETPLDVMAGYGVMIHEITNVLDHAPTHVFVQGGVGGLAAAVTAGLRQSWGDQGPRIFVVEPQLAACLFASARAGELRRIEIGEETVMAGLSCGEPSLVAWAILREEASGFMTIPDSMVGPAMRLLAHPIDTDPAIRAGESAVAGLAALIAVSRSDVMRERLSLDDKSEIVLIGSEGVTDPDVYARILNQEASA